MAVKINFDKSNNVIEPTLVLGTRRGRKLGKVPAYDIVFKDCLNRNSELAFKVNKANCANDKFWEQIVDFKLIWVKDWNKWFEIYVEIDDGVDTVKTVTAISLGEAELSQINLYNYEINTEADILRDDYVPTVLYNKSNPEASLLNRLLEKAPNYTIKHVDNTIANIQRTYSFDTTSILDAFYTIEEEVDCLFRIECYNDKNNKLLREISVYDLESYCNDCNKRGVYTDNCSNCGSTNIVPGYGKDTTIFVTTDNLADNISYTTDNGSVKNCFRLETGDDLMTATVINCNPNGTQYLWYVSPEMKEDMSPELAKRLDQYNTDYQTYQNTYAINITGDILTQYNNLVNKYKDKAPQYKTLTSPILGYANLMQAYYDVIDFNLYLSHEMMTSVEITGTTAQREVGKLTVANLSPVAVRDLKSCSKATADSSVLGMAKVLVNTNYQVKVTESSYASGKWTGKLSVTNYSDDTDTAVSNSITLTLNDDYEGYVKQKVDKALRQYSTDSDLSDIVGIFKQNGAAFTNTMKLYSLAGLQSFYECCQGCLDVLTEQGIGNNQTWASSENDLYQTLYIPYFNKLDIIEKEIKVREDEIAVITGRYDEKGGLVAEGMQSIFDKQIEFINDKLEFRKYLGEDLWLEFSAYRREDTFRNDNYISDGLDNAELFANAREFLSIAEKEIIKSATLQHSINSTLKDLLVMKEFAPIVDYFEVGNWIRVKVDNKIYKLRLLDYEIDYTDLNYIAITFSDVTKYGDGTSDLQSLLSQAAGISSTYDTTQRQAKKGESSKGILDNWSQKGLDVTNSKIISGADNQDQKWDSHGMLFREYDPITETYSDCQLKIINSTIAITDNNWMSIRTAIGGFYYYDPVTKELKYTYGINGETIIGKLILGENLGIYNANNSLTFDKNGLSISNTFNTFNVNPNSSHMLSLSNKTGEILWVDEGGGLHIIGDGSGLDIRANDAITGLHSEITQTAGEIRTLVEDTRSNLQSQITQNAGDISMLVTSVSGLNKSYSELKVTVDSISTTVSGLSGQYTTLKQTVDSISSTVTGLNGNYTELKQSYDSFTATVAKTEDGGLDVRSTFAMETNSIEITTGTVSFKSNTFIVDSDNFKVDKNGNIRCNKMIANDVTASGNFTYGTYSGSSNWTDPNYSTNHKVKSGAAMSTDGVMTGYYDGDVAGRVDFNGMDFGFGFQGLTLTGTGAIFLSAPNIYINKQKFSWNDESGGGGSGGVTTGTYSGSITIQGKVADTAGNWHDGSATIIFSNGGCTNIQYS